MKHNQNNVYGLFDSEELAQKALQELHAQHIQIETPQLLSSKNADHKLISATLTQAGATRSQANSFVEGVAAGKVLLLTQVPKQMVKSVYQIMQKVDQGQNGAKPENAGATVLPLEEELKAQAEAEVVTHNSTSNINTNPSTQYSNLKRDQDQLSLTNNNLPSVTPVTAAASRYVTDMAELGVFDEGIFEITTVAEQLVVGKRARVIEEVVVSKQVEIHTQFIQDEVRYTKVEVEQIEGQEVSSTNLTSDQNLDLVQ